MQEAVLFPFIDPAVRLIVICAAALVLLFFLSSLSDALRARERRTRRSPRTDANAMACAHVSTIDQQASAS
ncbi:hypothetical protein [Solimonas soli]|uniref:hypothetical protein n=1 Tax=Solimonas soli TaxID=413479 RepID=UPI0004894308|nr:hypothetical protein [Solimonas soli]